jgi:hypothetical protein
MTNNNAAVNHSAYIHRTQAGAQLGAELTQWLRCENLARLLPTEHPMRQRAVQLSEALRPLILQPRPAAELERERAAAERLGERAMSEWRATQTRHS